MGTIIITGSVGTGKTTLAKKLAEKLSYKYIDVNKTIKKYKITGGYDKKRKTKIINIKKLNKYLIKEIENFKSTNKKANTKKTINKKPLKNKINKKIKGVIIDSHLSHYLPKKYADLCIVTKCDLKVLEKRLKKRGYSKEKIRENLDAEIFDVCLEEAKGERHKIVTYVTKDINKGWNELMKRLK